MKTDDRKLSFYSSFTFSVGIAIAAPVILSLFLIRILSYFFNTPV